MNFLKKEPGHSEAAVSPVVGVMLMLVVTIIIAAVVSGFAGGLVGGTSQNAPLLTMDVKISNTGTYVGSGFSATVTSVSDPIKTKDIKIATSWRVTDSNSGDITSGGETSTPLVANVNSPEIGNGGSITSLIESNAPYGYGPGVNSSSGAQSLTNPFDKPDQQFGNYSLIQGTGLVAFAYGSNSEKAIGSSTGQSDDGGYGVVTPYEYNPGGSYTDASVDAATAVLGDDWEKLRSGDTVNVKVIHIPTGKVIFEKDVAVTEG
ncbi:type IV pilin [Methanolacinia paynteri]|uniref:type IV pilin n=1 Tax=Methanolacinia paynteri TaxID=230356 RepID=UPI0006933C9B|nr:type IV pilin N-terminal domain-containing protein [Methanolacinia paynteri]